MNNHQNTSLHIHLGKDGKGLVEGSALCKRKDGSEWENESAIYARTNSKTTFPWRQWKGKATGKYWLKWNMKYLWTFYYRADILQPNIPTILQAETKNTYM